MPVSRKSVDGRQVDDPPPRIRDSTVLVTGGAGFIGSHLATRLAPDNDVRILDNFEGGGPDAVPESVTVIEGDVTRPTDVEGAMANVDLVFHEAAIVSVEESVADPTRARRVNVDGTCNVLESARETGSRVVVASSAAVYGDPNSTPVTVDEPMTPRSPYGADKVAADAYARAYEESYGVPTVALRYFNVYGPGQSGPYSGVVEAFLRRAEEGSDLVVHGDGEQTRDFVHVSDVVRANLAAATTEHTGTAYNVGTGVSVSVNELADIVREETPGEVGIRRDSPRPGDVTHSRAATERTRDRLGFQSSVGLRDGLADLIARRDDVGTGRATGVPATDAVPGERDA